MRKLVVILSALAAFPLGLVSARATDLFAEWRALSTRLIMYNLTYPFVPNVPENGALALVRFEVGANGHIGAIRIDRSSGFPAFDRAAMAAVRMASPLPRPPGLGNPAISIGVPIRLIPPKAPA